LNLVLHGERQATNCLSHGITQQGSCTAHSQVTTITVLSHFPDNMRSKWEYKFSFWHSA
jgi:hypothetical protein